uniref:Uncharacterized protein n=1 Tax=Glossina palpalis gambiensis TaxID=67801 RepID=A0A1B0BWM6_9MUSC
YHHQLIINTIYHPSRGTNDNDFFKLLNNEDEVDRMTQHLAKSRWTLSDNSSMAYDAVKHIKSIAYVNLHHTRDKCIYIYIYQSELTDCCNVALRLPLLLVTLSHFESHFNGKVFLPSF